MAPGRDSIVLVMRGTCNFTDKALNVQRAGGRAMLLFDNQPGCVTMAFANSSWLADLTLPAISISQVQLRSHSGHTQATLKSNSGHTQVTGYPTALLPHDHCLPVCLPFAFSPQASGEALRDLLLQKGEAPQV